MVSSMPAPASSTNEHAICVVAKARSRRLVAGVIRMLPLVSANPAGPPLATLRRDRRSHSMEEAGGPDDGRRGTYASNTAAAMARPAPIQSTLGSTVTSRARTEKRAA